MPVSQLEHTTGAAAPSASVWKLAGPGLVVAAAGIGSGDVVSATVGGANYGVVLLWAIVIGALFKFVLNEGIARWQLANGTTMVEGWAEHLPAWVKVFFAAYLLLWTVAVSAALTNASGLGISNLTGGAISQPWGAVVHSLAGCAFVLTGGYAGFEKLIKVLVAIMGFSVLACALLMFEGVGPTLRGLLIPTIPTGSSRQVLSLIGGIGGTITILSYNYWMREEGISGPAYLRYVRGDVAIAYLFTAMFGVAVMLIANEAFFVSGMKITDAQAVPRMAEMLGRMLGPAGALTYSVGFWAAVFASLLGVWQSVPYLYADLYAIAKRLPPAARLEITKITSRPYRLALFFITLVPLPFAFVRRPLFIIVTFTIVGSVFVPFLAATLLYMNNRVRWTSPVPRNTWATNLALVIILVLFAVIVAQDVMPYVLQ
jgi:Mn2+/Fe2+ NRAMP family transporter